MWIVDRACTCVSQAAAEEEIKALLAKAKVKGIENQKRMAEEEAVKAAKRAERLELYKANNPDEEDDKKGGGEEGDDKGSDDDKKGGGDGGGGGGDDKPKKDGDDDDGLALV